MPELDKATQTQMTNIQTKTGKTLAQLRALIEKSGLAKHGEIVSMLKADLGLGHGDANALAHVVKKIQAEDAGAVPDDPLDDIYSGAKAGLRPLHNKVMAVIDKLGPYEVAPKKTYLSLRRKKQFAMVGPGSKGRLEVGLNMKDAPATDRLLAQPPGGMCQYKVFLADDKEVDATLKGWLKQAYDAAG